MMSHIDSSNDTKYHTSNIFDKSCDNSAGLPFDIESNMLYYKESIVRIFYNFTRQHDDYGLKVCEKQYSELICSLKTEICSNKHDTETVGQYVYFLKLLYKMVAQTRDISHGKGERDLTYMMIYVWWKHFPKMGVLLFYSMLCSTDIDTMWDLCNTKVIDTSRPYRKHIDGYGRFKDVKYFCHYVLKTQSESVSSMPIVAHAITWLNQRLYDDYKEYTHCSHSNDYRDCLLLACKWIPREKNKHGWIFEKMAIQWCYSICPKILQRNVPIHNYEEFFGSIYSDISFAHIKAITKCKMEYRKIVSLLSKAVDVAEIKKCNGKWSDISPQTITMDAYFRQYNAFHNVDNTFFYRKETMADIDRRECAHNIKEYEFHKSHTPHAPNDIPENQDVLPDSRKNTTGIRRSKFSSLYQVQKGYSKGCFSPTDFVKKAIQLIHSKKNLPDISTAVVDENKAGSSYSYFYLQNILYQIDQLNIQWKTMSEKCNPLDVFIPIIDFSVSMNEAARFNAIGMACLISEKSIIKNRIMVMDNLPVWISLHDCNGFVEKVEMLYTFYNRNTIANINAALTMISDALHYSHPIDSYKVQHNGEHRAYDMKLVIVLFTNNSSLQNNTMNIDDVWNKRENHIPHIVFWNCSDGSSYREYKSMSYDTPMSSNYYGPRENSASIQKDIVSLCPCSPFNEKTTMISGSNAELLNYFSFIGWGNHYENNSYKTMELILNEDRYYYIDQVFDRYF
jgi:hypothetical protein